MLNNILYTFFLLFVKLVQVLPKKIRRGFFLLLSRLVYLFAFKTNKIIKTNLDFVFDKKLSDEEIKDIQKYSYFNITLWVLSLIENLKMKDKELKESVSIENIEIIEKLRKENKPIILISAHFGNMEILGAYLNKFVTPLIQVARESNFKEIDEFIIKSREKFGSKIVYKSGALKYLVKALKKKEVVSLIIDQSINHSQGDEVEFLGKRCFQSSSTSLLSRKFDAYIVPIAIFNEDEYKYKIKVYDAIAPIKTEDEESDLQKLSQLQANSLSAIIYEDPKQWFWPHKRFKTHNKEIYEKNFNNK
jgi:KDO2-lipid IV(A) lauroyltransferase